MSVYYFPIFKNSPISSLNQNNKIFLNHLRGDIFFKDFKLKGASNYGLHLILKKKNSILFRKILRVLDKSLIEYRLGSLGNQIRNFSTVDFAVSKLLDIAKNIDRYKYVGVVTNIG